MAWIDPTTQDLSVTIAGDLARPSSITAERAYLRLFCERGSCFWDVTFGSRLHLLRRRKITATFARELEDVVKEALRPLLETGDLVGLTFAHERASSTRWHCAVEMQDHARLPVAFDIWVGVA